MDILDCVDVPVGIDNGTLVFLTVLVKNRTEYVDTCPDLFNRVYRYRIMSESSF